MGAMEMFYPDQDSVLHGGVHTILEDKVKRETVNLAGDYIVRVSGRASPYNINRLLLVDINHLELSSSDTLPALALPEEGGLLGLDDVPGDIAQLGVLSDLVGRASTDGVTINVDSGFLSEVEPDDGAILGIDGAADLLQGLLEALDGGLAAAVDLEAGHTTEVGASGDRVRELLDLVEMVGHTDRRFHFPHGGGVSSPGGCD